MVSLPLCLRPAAALLPALLAACAGAPASGSVAADAAAGCEVRVLLELAAPAEKRPDLVPLARKAGVELTLEHTVSPTILAARLRSDRDGADCRGALERLRADPQVRSVEIDSRRRAHARS